LLLLENSSPYGYRLWHNIENRPERKVRDEHPFVCGYRYRRLGTWWSYRCRELAQRGKKVLLLERGIDHRPRSYYGSYLGALIYSDRLSLLFTKEGLNIVRPLMVGGATSMYCGCAAPPPAWLKRSTDQYGCGSI
jgi:hypothetical protein